VIAITLLSLGGALRLPRADASGSFLLFAARRNRFREVSHLRAVKRRSRPSSDV